MTSEDEKTVHQQSITGPLGEQPTAVNAAIHVACIDRGPASGRQQRVSEAAVTLAAEVQRLRVVLEAALLTIQKDAPELRRLRERYDLEQKTAFVLAQKLTAMGDEVARLQVVVADQALTIGTQKDELGRLREERAELVAYGDGWKQQWTEMRDTMWKPAMDKLDRVEDWYKRTTTSDPAELCDAMNELGNTILR